MFSQECPLKSTVDILGISDFISHNVQGYFTVSLRLHFSSFSELFSGCSCEKPENKKDLKWGLIGGES